MSVKIFMFKKNCGEELRQFMGNFVCLKKRNKGNNETII